MVFTFYFADYIKPSNINIYSRLGVYRLLSFTIHSLSVKFSWSSDSSELQLLCMEIADAADNFWSHKKVKLLAQR